MNPLERVRTGQIAVGELLISVQQHIPLTSAPSTDTTHPHHQSSHLVASVTGVGSHGAIISGDGGVTVHKWCWDGEVWTNHCMQGGQ